MTKKDIVTAQTFVVDMPNEAPPLGFDPSLDGFTWRDVLPQNYMNLDWLEEKAQQLGGNPVFTPARILIQPVIDPEDKTPDLTPKLVMEFTERVPALVLNRTRCTILTKLAGMPNPARWLDNLAGIPLEIYAGLDKDFSAAMQILFRPVAGKGNGSGKPVPNSQRGIPTDGDALNDDLFG